MKKILLILIVFSLLEACSIKDWSPKNTKIIMPLAGTGIIELNGPVIDGQVQILSLSGEIITTSQTGTGGVFTFKIPGDKQYLFEQGPFIVIESHGGKDVGVTHVGYSRESEVKDVKGIISGLVPVSIIKNGEPFHLNVVSSYIHESLVQEGGTFSMDRIDQHGKELSIGDLNQDGSENYRDVLDLDVTKYETNTAIDMITMFTMIIYSDNNTERDMILKQIRLGENLAILSLVPENTGGRPSIKLTKSPSAVKILYTLDGSYPEINGATTIEYISGTLIRSQDAELNYGEVFSDDGKMTIGEISTFHILHDPVSWSLDRQTIIKDIPTESMITRGSYKKGTYEIFTNYNLLKEKRKYPAQIWIEVHLKGYKFGEDHYSDRFVTYDELYETNLRKMLIQSAEKQIQALLDDQDTSNIDIKMNLIKTLDPSYAQEKCTKDTVDVISVVNGRSNNAVIHNDKRLFDQYRLIRATQFFLPPQ